MTNPDEEENLKEEIEKALTAMNNYIKEGYDALANQQDISDREIYQLFAEIMGQEQADKLLSQRKWNTKLFLRDISLFLMEEPEYRKKFEERGFNHEEITKLPVNLNLLPNSENAVVDIRKLREYCLNPEHSKGKDKARLFSSMLGITADNAEELRQVILTAARIYEVSLNRCDQYGQRYTLDFPLTSKDRTATIRTGWIIEDGSDIPRLTSCYPLL
ncbi:DUF6883 domain-containing protein [Nostoc sp. PCC 7107]|uniref:DUF6883 domain-containing protein n=1 Tax=Nostoc sp. PCC 7107 TaxID=317936 RepID=UPI00029EEB5C|nr:DUF6883 domain-containing protein [Nostoc sp. PCC 7107]AFY43108.1 hypothetical protein Nos7107_2502 [Nostoc sp. PCC 7107]